MVDLLGRKAVLFFSCILTSVMFAIVMFFANPAIDGGSGFDLLALQLSFDKESGLAIINRWGEAGVDNFKKYIVFDYVYALSYALLFSSVLRFLWLRGHEGSVVRNQWFISFAVSAGLLDWIENTLEFFFIKYPESYPGWLFFLHSALSVLKWGMVALVVSYALVLGARGKAGRPARG